MTSIEWTRGDDGSEGKTWNPTRGCSRVSPGCDNCYAMRQAHRFSSGPRNGKVQPYDGLTTIRRGKVDWSGRVVLVPEMLDAPLRWRKPRRVFVNSMSDLFHESLSNEQIAAVFGVMAACPQHTFQVLTKRSKRMREWFEWLDAQVGEHDPDHALQCGIHAANHCADVDYLGLRARWPLPNAWLGVSAEDQQRADERIPDLLATPAAVRFVSAEPLLGRLDLSRWLAIPNTDDPLLRDDPHAAFLLHEAIREGRGDARRAIDWLIAGGESGHGARPSDVEWYQQLERQCRAAGVAFFLKQLGANPRLANKRVPLKHSKGGDMSQWPVGVPRIRQFPGEPHAD